MRNVGRHARILALSFVLALLSSCGGGGGDAPSVGSAIATDEEVSGTRKKAQAFVPPVTIPGDANVRGMWSPVYPWPIIAVHSVLLPDGRVLTYGSDASGQQTAHANVDVWDSTGAPDANHMTLPNGTGTDIFCSSQLVLPQTGSVFIAGGDVWNGTRTTNGPNNNSNLFDYATNSLTRGPNLQRARWYSSSTTLINGETYIQGGSGGGDRPEIRGLNGSLRLMTGIDTNPIGTSFPRNFVAPDGRVFGYDPGNGRMYYVNPNGLGSISLGSSFNAAYSGGWYSSAAMYRPGRILQIGGNSNGAYTIDITGAAPVVTPTQSMSSTRAWVNATILADGKVVATSGSAVQGSATGYNNIAEIWDPTSGQWVQGAVAQKMRLYHSNALLLPDASVLVAGGGAISTSPPSGDPNTNNLNAEIYYPPYLFAADGVRSVRAARPTISGAPDWIDIGKTFGFDVAGAAGISRVTLVKTGSATHSFNLDQRFVDLTFRATGLHVAVQAPTRAADAPPGYYMMFVFNESGTPSVAKMVRMGIATDPNPAINPVLTNPGSQTSIIGASADLALAASDPNGDVLSFSATGLPSGLSINATTGRITGAVSTAGSFNVVVSATDSVNTASVSFVWTVQTASPLTLTPPPSPAFVVTNGTATYVASATGGANLRYQWNFGDGTAVTPWSASSSVTHTYAASGIYSVTVTVTDDSQSVQSRSFSQAVYRTQTTNAPSASANLLFERPAIGTPRLWVVNQDNDSLSVFNAATNAKLGEVPVGTAPRTIALARNGLVWASNKRSSTISVIDPATLTVTRTIDLPRGSQPFGIAMSSVADVAYVVLEAGGQLLMFDTKTYAQTRSAALGMNARHVSVSADGANVFVSRYITPPLTGESTAVVTTTGSAGGEVMQLNGSTLALVRTIMLRHSDLPDGENQGRGIPNYLGPAVISPDGTQAWVPSKQDNIKRGGLRDGLALNFQNTVRAISSRIDLSSNTEDLPARIDHDNASLATAAVYDSHGVYLFVALETSREVAVLNAFSGAELFRVNVGRAPQGLAISPDESSLYVSNFMDRTVSVRNLGPLLIDGQYDLPLVTTLQSVTTERLAANVLLGKQHFYDARDTRLARDRYMSCASCHNDGGHDGRVWDLTSMGEGLRNTISLRGRAGGQGFKHWSNNFDEVQDFEGQIRALSGGSGLMNDTLFFDGTRSAPLGATKSGLSADLDALAAYVASLSAFDPAPARPGATTLSAPAIAGKTVFTQQNCAVCHSGTAFTASGANTLVDVGTLKTSSGSRLSGPLTGIDVPTLRDVWATAPYLHDGSAWSIETAVRAHATTLSINDSDLASLTQYLREIGSDEPPAISNTGGGTGLNGAYFSNRTLSGTPVLTRIEAVNFSWPSGSPGPGVSSKNFSVRWKGFLMVPSTGAYRFQTNSDGGVRLWVGGSPLIDNWVAHKATVDTSGSVNLVGGQVVQIQLDYFDQAGSGVIQLRWSPPGSPQYLAIPAASLLPSR